MLGSRTPMTDQTLRRIAAEHGTPTYVYDLDKITARYREVSAAFPAASVHYAVKANGLGAVLSHLRGLGAGAEALTLGELERALRAGFEPGRIVLGGPGHTTAVAERAAAAGVTLVSLDSRGAWEVWKEVAAPHTRFVVRLNPGFDPHTHEHLATAAAHSKFGVPHDEAVAIAEEVAQRRRLAGFHVHAGSMIDDPIVAELVVAALEPLYQHFRGLEVVDVGGGYAVPDAPLARFAAPLRAFAARHGVRLVIEPGRFLVAEAGVLLTRVLHLKTGGAVAHVIADAGMADLLRPALYGAEHPIRTVAEAPGPAAPARASTTVEPVEVDVDGPLCENADRLGRDVPLAVADAGTLLAVELAGAYGYAMASNYASSLRPAQVVVEGEHYRLASRRELPEDLWRLEEDGEPAPAPGLTPRQVLDLVLEAFGAADGGTALLYRFASDSLLGKMGSLADLRRTFSNELFAPLAGGQPREVDEFELRGEVARAVVISQGARFVFGLATRRHGRHPGCWLVTAVARDLPGN